MKVTIICDGPIRLFSLTDRLRKAWQAQGIADKAGNSWETPLRMSVNSTVRMTHSYAGRGARKEDSVLQALSFLLRGRIFGNAPGSLEVAFPKEIFRLLSRQDLQRLVRECGIRKFTVYY
ncbi:hypothetical protein COT99_02755 [Candidatus Falkowbacteria bacterium CG10_big_fil_rev_8_21_14_0_10_43_10]|uniref:Uncharacterized protein n=1 Tax=Candidatus Falkowbacteria bacterium CG10_big_fil_rev_8_21_14_0_10_43_10 TaxID=1974567 RepID=A0A2H0V1W7_9BACT|nr:MAG: hypothetical protein COT99_02755 [Candidatus Falkowbacteria bacterium CG10_big_fil_rev_8_21_14_0_10_43_10]